HLTVEVRCRVAGPHVQQVELRIVGTGDPAVRTAPRPGLAVLGPGVGPGLARLGHRVATPDVLPGLEVEGVQVPAYAEFPAGATDDDQVLDDKGRHRGALPGPHVAVGLVPDGLAVGGVERYDVGVLGGVEDLSVRHGDPAVHVEIGRASCRERV